MARLRRAQRAATPTEDALPLFCVLAGRCSDGMMIRFGTADQKGRAELLAAAEREWFAAHSDQDRDWRGRFAAEAASLAAHGCDDPAVEAEHFERFQLWATSGVGGFY